MAERRKVTISAPVAVLVEGPDEQRFYEALARKAAISGLQFVDMQGKDNTTPAVRAVSYAPGRENLRALGVILDSDGRPEDAFRKGADALERAGLTRPESSGLVAQGTLNTGVLVVEGNLESLCREAAEQDPSLQGRAQCVRAFVECITRSGMTLRNESKTWVHAFLAACGRGDVRVGEGAERGDWPLMSDVFEPVRAFLRDLNRLASAQDERRADPQDGGPNPA